MPKILEVTIEGISPYSQRKHHETPKLNKESNDDYEARTWRESTHCTKDGFIFIPASAFKICLETAAQRFSEKIPGKGKATYTKHFEAGVMVVDPLILDIKKDEVSCLRLFVPPDGKPKGGKRVWRNFPIIPEWGGKVIFNILDDTVTHDIFTHFLELSGQFIGLGVYRPEKRGYQGRFKVIKVKEIG